MFQFHYTITDDDYLKFNINHSTQTNIGKATVLTMQLSIPFILVFIILLSFINGSTFSALMVETIIFTIVSIFWIIYYKKSITRSLKRTMRATKKSGRLPYIANGTLIFDENFMHEDTALQEIKTAYSLIEKIYTTNEALYIYTSAVSAVILPYRFIESQEVFNSLVGFLQEKTGKTIINITK